MFLDAQDRQMVLMRDGLRVSPLAGGRLAWSPPGSAFVMGSVFCCGRQAVV